MRKTFGSRGQLPIDNMQTEKREIIDRSFKLQSRLHSYYRHCKKLLINTAAAAVIAAAMGL